MTTIVVGVDGSDGSKLALRWAIDEATHIDGATIVAIGTWTYPMVAASPFAGGYDVPLDLSEITADVLRDAVAEVVADTGFAPERITTKVVNGPAAGALIDAGADADLLVVGTRGHGGFTGLLLGSVSHQIAAHAPCPVVIVPKPAD